MSNFSALLTANDTMLVKIFYKFKADPNIDLIQNINNIAAKLRLNHAQLVCSIGFNKNIRDLTDIITILGFKSYKLMTYRRNELFTKDLYKDISVEDILDLYSERLEDEGILSTLREIILTRLTHIENTIEKSENPGLTMSYCLEMRSIYKSGIADKAFSESRLKSNISKYRILASEINEMIDENIFPPSNLFFMDDIGLDEKQLLIENKYIPHEMIKNRLQNTKISAEERELLENFV